MVFDSVVSDSYFDTMGIPILEGRVFIESDNADMPAVAIVNEQFAHHYWRRGATQQVEPPPPAVWSIRRRQPFVVPIGVQVIFVLGLQSRQNCSAFIHLAVLQ